MKKQLLIAVFSVLTVVFATQSVIGHIKGLTGPLFVWESTVYDFGTIELNKPVDHIFEFTNTGDVPLIISNAKASCGCTVADYTREPIAPGSKGFVSARYNAAHAGAFTKTVTVTANTGEQAVVLTLKGVVKAAE
ncbi:MAG: DUF1573 domain-containing protein [Cyclobacteriaceae bacterium]|nr:DUF1573 domain-containing protein [Cyclobacteriaceae bacterium]